MPKSTWILMSMRIRIQMPMGIRILMPMGIRILMLMDIKALMPIAHQDPDAHGHTCYLQNGGSRFVFRRPDQLYVARSRLLLAV